MVVIVAGAGCIGNFFEIAGIENVFLAMASCLNNSFPIFVMMIAFFLLNERLNRNQMIAISFAFGGMVLMTYASLKGKTDAIGGGLSPTK